MFHLLFCLQLPFGNGFIPVYQGAGVPNEALFKPVDAVIFIPTIVDVKL